MQHSVADSRCTSFCEGVICYLLLCKHNIEPNYALDMQVLEIGQVGRAGSVSGQNYSFFAHSQKAPAFGDATAVLHALQQASQQTLDLQVGTHVMDVCVMSEMHSGCSLSSSLSHNLCLLCGFGHAVLSSPCFALSFSCQSLPQTRTGAKLGKPASPNNESTGLIVHTGQPRSCKH